LRADDDADNKWVEAESDRHEERDRRERRANGQLDKEDCDV
jgi:hypothetical protein